MSGLLASLPSLYIRLFRSERIVEGLSADRNNFELFYWFGLVGLIIAILALIYYLTRSRTISEPEPTYVPQAFTPVFQTAEPPPAPAPTVAGPGPSLVDAAGQRPRPKTEVITRAPSRLAYLIDTNSTRLFLLGESTSIGQNPENDIPLDEPSVSGRHAKIKLENGRFAIFDLASSNGTRVNGNMVSHLTLTNGDRVRMGRMELVFKELDVFDTMPVDISPSPLLVLEAAAPNEVVMMESFDLAVIIRWPTSLPLEEQGLEKVRSNPMRPIWPRGNESIELIVGVLVSPEDFHMTSPPVQTTRVFWDGDSPKLYFKLTPLRLGVLTIFVNVYQKLDDKKENETRGSARLALGVLEHGGGPIVISTFSLDSFGKAHVDRGVLLDIIDCTFSEKELKTLCFRMSIDYENLPGISKSGKARELILLCRRLGMLKVLYNRVMAERPNWGESMHVFYS